MTIFITGGHATAAIAMIEELRLRLPSWHIVFIGRRYAFEGKGIESEEYRMIRAKGIPFLSLVAGRLTRAVTLFTLWSIIKIPFGFLQSFWFVLMHRPTAVLSFGGYIGFPVVCAARLLGIAAFSHDQTRVPGLGTRLASLLGAKIFLSFPNAKMPNALLTGLPIRKALFRPARRPSWVPSISKPILYITGGSTGSVSLNALVSPLIPILSKEYLVIHQTGALFQKNSFRNPSYISIRYIDMPDYAWILQNAGLIVGRSGANTVGEIGALGKVAIFVPLPWSAGGEQKENALYLAKNGGAVVLDQKTLTSKTLHSQIMNVAQHIETFKKRAKSFSSRIPRDGAARLVDAIASEIRYA